MTTLIVDDEPMARAHLRRLLENQDVQIAGEADNAAMALQLTEDLQPDLLLLDIQMPGLTGLQIASALLNLSPAPLLVFVTGYSEHAVAAFEQNALDYLVKPVSSDRLAKTLARARERLADTKARADVTRMVSARAASEPVTLRRLPIRTDYAVRLIRLEDIGWAEARDKRVFVHTKEGEHRTYYTLTQLETLLPSDRFQRIHDSYLVNLDMVEELLFLGNHAYAVSLSGNKQLPVGRTRYARLQHRLGLNTVSRF